MRVGLTYGGRYRARVTVPLGLQSLFSPSVVQEQMKLYQLYGDVVAVGQTYIVTAQFRGESGSYNLPEQVEAIDKIG